MSIRQACVLASLLCAVIHLNAQKVDSGLNELSADKYIQAVCKKSEQLRQKLDRTSWRALKKFQRLEMKIQRKLASDDSSKVATVFKNATEEYQKLQEKLEVFSSLQQYLPSLDSLSSSLKFLEQNPNLLSSSGEARHKLKDALTSVKELEGKLQKAEDIKRFLKQRQEYLKAQLTSLGFARNLKKINKQVYYYGAQLQEYKSLLKDHKKAERKGLELLSKTDVFRKFMRKNSMLASLFRLPGDPNDPVSQQANLAGLQTRAQVNGLILQQISAGGPNGQQQFQQNLQAAQSQLNELKNRVNKLGNDSSDDIMPEGFKPNSQKTKGFFKRLELGTNIQSQKANGYFPVTSDIGLSLGFKISEKSIVGIGGSYKIGWGRNIRHINITHQGAGIRSFIDFKIKGSFWLSGGFEMNYRSEFDNVEQLKDLNAWQQVGLIGVSKVVSLKTRFFKKTKLQILWDFLSYEQVPRTQAVSFRIGYTF